MLCDVLKEQFMLFMDNFHQYETLRNNTSAAENPVVSMIFRKLKKILSETPEPDDFEQTIAEMKAQIR